jgi:hypothetical protein
MMSLTHSNFWPALDVALKNVFMAQNVEVQDHSLMLGCLGDQQNHSSHYNTENLSF